jgi:hypothetical protein
MARPASWSRWALVGFVHALLVLNVTVSIINASLKE